MENFIEVFIQSDMFPLFLRILEFLFMTILFIKGEISVSKYAQSFTNMEQRFILSKDNNVILDKEETNLQEEMNSHKDECLSSFLDKYLDFSSDTLPFTVDQMADGEFDMLNQLVGSKADKVLSAYDKLMDIRERYNVPDKYSNEELVAYLREMASHNKVEEKGVEVNEKAQETVPQSEQA